MNREPFSLMNKDISITLRTIQKGRKGLIPVEVMTWGGKRSEIKINTPPHAIAVLDCCTKSGDLVALSLARPDPLSTDPYRRTLPDCGPLYLDADDIPSRAGFQAMLVTAHLRPDPLEHIGGPRLTTFVIRRHPDSEGGFEVLQMIGPTQGGGSGMATVTLAKRDSGGVVFAKEYDAFAVFLNAAHGQSGWELVTGSRTRVSELSRTFKEDFHRSLPSHLRLRQPLDRTGDEPPLEDLLEVSRRPIGYLLTIKVEKEASKQTYASAKYFFNSI